MAFLSNAQLFVQKMEATAGTPVANIEAETVKVRIRELDFSVSTEKDDENSKYLTGDYAGNDESIIGKKTGTASYSIKFAPAEFDTAKASNKHTLTYADFLKNAGLQETLVAVTDADPLGGKYVYYPSSSNSEKTATVARLVQGKNDAGVTKYNVETLAGAMSNISIGVDGVGKPFKFSFETMGRVVDVKTVDAIGGLNEADIMRTVADKFLNTVVKIKDLSNNVETNFCVNTLNFASGNEIVEVECQDNTSGVKNYIITGMNPTIELDPLLKTLADFDYWGALTNEKFYSITVESEYLKLFIPRAQILNSAVGDANGFLRNTLSMRALRNIDKVDYLGATGTGVAEAMWYLVIDERAPQY